MAPSRLVLNVLRAFLRADATSTIPRSKECLRLNRQYSSWLPQSTRTNDSLLRTTRTKLTHPFQMSPRHQQCRGYARYKTVEQAKSRQRVGPVSPLAVLLFIGTGVGMYFYVQYEKDRMERKRIAEHSKGMGKPKVGGSFQLVDQNGQAWNSDKMHGKYSLVYFGFSHCPDICPEELDKMAAMLALVENAVPSSKETNPELLPIFITCDPARDTPEVLKVYLKEFDDSFIGLTGTHNQIKDVCKAYRVYFSTPPDVKPGMDYLVDHSIYFYLMDPEGDFVEAIGRQHTAEEGANVIAKHMQDWKGQIVKR